METTVKKANALLKLDRQIVGVKLVNTKEEFEKYQAITAVAPISYCVAVKSATLGHSLKFTVENSGCGGSTRALGLQAPTENFYNGKDGCRLGLYCDEELSANVASKTKICEPGTYGVIVKPLVDTANPDDAAKYLKSEVFPGEIITTTKKFAEENPDTVQSFVNAISKATDWMNEHTGEEIAASISSYYEGMDEAVLAQKLDIVKTSLTKTGRIDEEPETAVQNFCIGNGVITEQIPYGDIVDMTFVDNYQSEK